MLLRSGLRHGWQKVPWGKLTILISNVVSCRAFRSLKMDCVYQTAALSLVAQLVRCERDRL